jgi:hypothetical protein
MNIADDEHRAIECRMQWKLSLVLAALKHCVKTMTCCSQSGSREFQGSHRPLKRHR